MTPQSKLYVQMRPDQTGLDSLLALQRVLPTAAPARLVRSGDIHLTVIHICILHKLCASMLPYTTISKTTLLERVTALAQALETVVRRYGNAGFSLQPTGLAGFGANQSTLVMTFDTSTELQALHTESLQLLQNWFKAQGIADVSAFMAQDDNLQHALSLRPHVSFARLISADRADIVSAIQTDVTTPLTFNLMPVVYQS